MGKGKGNKKAKKVTKNGDPGLGFSPYQRDKGMAYAPTPKDKNREERRQAKRKLKDGDYE
jgi:hypothetical protein